MAATNINLGESSRTSTSFTCSISDGTGAGSKDTNHLSLLGQLPPSLWAKFSTDIGKIHSVPPSKIQIDPSPPLPRVNQ